MMVESRPGAATHLKVEPKFDKLKKNEKGGVKDDSGKRKWHLLPREALIDTVKVLEMGAVKYSANNWKNVDRYRYVDAFDRHWAAFLDGEAIDPESGLSHIAHALCNLLFIAHQYRGQAFDASEIPKEYYKS